MAFRPLLNVRLTPTTSPSSRPHSGTKRLHKRWQRYEKQLPGHRVQIDVKFVHPCPASPAPQVLPVHRHRRLRPAAGAADLPGLQPEDGDRLYNYFERTKNQDIDFEPSGGTLDSGPRGYLILGNTFVHSSKGGRSVSLSGVSGDIPASNNTFAYNQIRGGGLGMIDGQYTSIVGNYIEGSSGPEATRAVVVLRGTLRGIRFANNHIVRPTGAPEGPLLVVASELHQPTFASEVAIDATTDEFTRRNHGLDTGTGPVRMTTSGTLPSGLALATNYWVIRVDDHVLKLAATRADAMNSMAIDITDVGIGIQTMTVVNFPHGVDVYDNRLHTYVAAVAGDPKKNRGVAAVTFRNAQDCSFSNNEIHSYSGVVIPNAVRFDTSPAILRTVKGWDINGNRFRGDAKADETGVFTNAILIKPMGVEVEDIRINFNNFRGCTNQICWSVGPEGTYLTVPMVMGNNGDGIPYRIDTDGVPDLDLDAILIGGNDGAHMTDNLLSGSAALYCGGGEPSFPAALGSIYMRTGGSGEGLLYVNTDGVAAWQPFA